MDSSTSRERFIKKVAAKLAIDRHTLAPLIEAQLTKLADEIDGKCPAVGSQPAAEEHSQATMAANMAANWELWHTVSQDACATIPVANHKETWPMRSQTFRRFFAKHFFDEYGKAMSSEALSAAANLLEAQALFEGDENAVHVRVAQHEGAIYLDLCNPNWQVVRVTSAGWQVIDDPPVRFRRSRGMLSLPIPERGGSVEMLRGILNLDDAAWRLVISWLVATLRPHGPYPVLALFAEQGSGKSTMARLLRQLVDPNAAPLRAEPKDSRDLMIAANNAWCLAYDNLSTLSPWLSDAFCRLSTGGGFATRELFTDQEEVIFDSQRPVLLTGIEEVATRSDLLDRCLVVWLPEIPKEHRRAEAEIFESFQKTRPPILGALLDAVAVALRRLPSIKLAGLPRMADFALWVSAAETAFGWPAGTFLATYQGNRESTNELALEASVVAGPLVELLDREGQWLGSSGELLILLEDRIGDRVRRLVGWPKNPRALTGHLKRLAPNLRMAGWILKQDRSSKKRLWIIGRSEGTNAFASSPSSGPSQKTECKSMHFEESWCETCCHDANDANSGPPWNPDRY